MTTEPATIQLEANGLTFRARAAGPADGRVVLLLHGFPQTSRCWTAQLDVLAAAGYRAVAVDQRGYSPGARPDDPSAYAMAHLVDDVLGMIASLGTDRVDLVGHDFGGSVAWTVAGHHPDLVRTLTIASTPHPLAFMRAYQARSNGGAAAGGAGGAAGGAGGAEGGGAGDAAAGGAGGAAAGGAGGAAGGGSGADGAAAGGAGGAEGGGAGGAAAGGAGGAAAGGSGAGEGGSEQNQRSGYMRTFRESPRGQVEEGLLANDAAALRAAYAGLPAASVEAHVADMSEPGVLVAAVDWYRAMSAKASAAVPPCPVPTLYAWSDDDPSIGRAAAEATAELVTGPFRFVVLEGVSHWIPEQAAATFTPLLLANLAGEDPPR